MAQKPHSFRALSKPKKLLKSEQRHYWPYIPLLLLIASTFLVSIVQPIHKRGVLSYATSMSTNDLLLATNDQRTQNGAKTLKLNDSLTSAAQAKANDMVARNYWSHNTPDGQQPWIFIDQVGYKYQKAGENLAYGFATSNSTVTGWMNSPSHRENLLSTDFTEVGFGYANGPNYNNSGEETVVVAMYGRPWVLSASTPTPKAPAPQPVAQAQTQPTPTPAPSSTAPVTTDTPIVSEPATKQIARVQSITNGQAPWALFGIGLLTGLALTLLLVKHAVGLRHLIRDSERFVLHHTMFDFVLVSLVLVGSFLSQTTGFIR